MLDSSLNSMYYVGSHSHDYSKVDILGYFGGLRGRQGLGTYWGSLYLGVF